MKSFDCFTGKIWRSLTHSLLIANSEYFRKQYKRIEQDSSIEEDITPANIPSSPCLTVNHRFVSVDTHIVGENDKMRAPRTASSSDDLAARI